MRIEYENLVGFASIAEDAQGNVQIMEGKIDYDYHSNGKLKQKNESTTNLNGVLIYEELFLYNENGEQTHMRMHEYDINGKKFRTLENIYIENILSTKTEKLFYPSGQMMQIIYLEYIGKGIRRSRGRVSRYDEKGQSIQRDHISKEGARDKSDFHPLLTYIIRSTFIPKEEFEDQSQFAEILPKIPAGYDPEAKIDFDPSNPTATSFKDQYFLAYKMWMNSEGYNQLKKDLNSNVLITLISFDNYQYDEHRMVTKLEKMTEFIQNRNPASKETIEYKNDYKKNLNFEKYVSSVHYYANGQVKRTEDITYNRRNITKKEIIMSYNTDGTQK